MRSGVSVDLDVRSAKIRERVTDDAEVEEAACSDGPMTANRAGVVVAVAAEKWKAEGAAARKDRGSTSEKTRREAVMRSGNCESQGSKSCVSLHSHLARYSRAKLLQPKRARVLSAQLILQPRVSRWVFDIVRFDAISTSLCFTGLVKDAEDGSRKQTDTSDCWGGHDDRASRSIT